MKTLLLLLPICLFSSFGFSQLFGPQIEISQSVDGVSDVHSADLDGDGDMDVLSASLVDDEIAWYENDGNGSFSGQNVISNNTNEATDVYAADIDGDGDPDVLSASQGDNKIAWYKNDGNGNFDDQQIITTDAEGAKSVFASDLDGDGDLDVLSASDNDGKIAWYDNDGEGNFGSQQVVIIFENDAYSVHASDIDGDGDMDILSSSFGQGESSLVWHENDGAGNFGIQQTISTNSIQTTSLVTADIDGDNDLDVLCGSSSGMLVSWFQNDGNGNFSGQIEISPPGVEIGFIDVGDLDDDGDIDIVACLTEGPVPVNDRIVWYENYGNGVFSDENLIASQTLALRSVMAVDLDGNNSLDILTASFGSDTIFWYENLAGQGCTNTTACNYNDAAVEENGSCCYTECGCTNLLAINFNDEATCEDSSCEFRISGIVFFDENENGIMDGPDYGLSFQTITVEPLGQTLITNNGGEFDFTMVPGQSTITLQDNLLFPFNTTPNPATFDTSSADETTFFFGVSNEEPDFAVCIDLYPNGNNFLCNDWSTHNICFRNMGNVPIDGVVELEYDELFQDHQAVTPIDSVNGNKVYMSFDNLLPGEMFFYDVDLLTPTVDFIGEYVTSFARVYGYFEEDQVAFGEQELTMEITCAYDPNDKQAFPIGYTDEHWVLQETEQEFLVRFQNTGNAPAQNIRIIDSLDVNWDLNTLRVIANSHSVFTTINEEDRTIDFFFEDIMLPDSVNNEPDSHGLISYKITPIADLSDGTILNNTAYIYFDNNEPIVTNTTWTTIHECGGEAEFEASSTAGCVGEELDFTSSYSAVESYQWDVDLTPFGTDDTYTYISTLPGEIGVQLTAINPLCTEASVQTFPIYENPSSEFESSALEICSGETINFVATGENSQSFEWLVDSENVGEGQEIELSFEESAEFDLSLVTLFEVCTDTISQTITVFDNPLAEFTENGAMLTATENISYQWLFNGNPIDGATNQTYEALEDGDYSVMVINENGCVSTSLEAMIVSISELNEHSIVIYPNPASDMAFLEFSDASLKTIKLIDALGKEVRVWEHVATQKLEFSKSDLAPGNYIFQIEESGKKAAVRLIVR